jgi:hypothetical protein
MMNIEEALRAIREKVAVVRYVASSAAENDEAPDRAVLAGIETVCEEIESMAGAVARTLPGAVLGAELRISRQLFHN